MWVRRARFRRETQRMLGFMNGLEDEEVFETMRVAEDDWDPDFEDYALYFKKCMCRLSKHLRAEPKQKHRQRG